jgi:hypothetical protein
MAKSSAGPIIAIAAVVAIGLYAMQTGGPPDSSGVDDAVRDIPVPGVTEAGDKIAEGAKKGADAAADDVTPWIVSNATLVAAMITAVAAIAFYKKHKVMTLILGAAALAAFLVYLG